MSGASSIVAHKDARGDKAGVLVSISIGSLSLSFSHSHALLRFTFVKEGAKEAQQVGKPVGKSV